MRAILSAYGRSAHYKFVLTFSMIIGREQFCIWILFIFASDFEHVLQCPCVAIVA